MWRRRCSIELRFFDEETRKDEGLGSAGQKASPKLAAGRLVDFVDMLWYIVNINSFWMGVYAGSNEFLFARIFWLFFSN